MWNRLVVICKGTKTEIECFKGMWNSYYVKTRVIPTSEKSWNYINFKIQKFPVEQLRECPGIMNIGRPASEITYRKATKYRVSIKSFPDYKHLLQANYCTWNTNFFFSKWNSRSFFYNTLVFVQNLNYCTWNTNFFFSKWNSRSFFYNTLVFVQNLNYCTWNTNFFFKMELKKFFFTTH